MPLSQLKPPLPLFWILRHPQRAPQRNATDQRSKERPLPVQKLLSRFTRPHPPLSSLQTPTAIGYIHPKLHSNPVPIPLSPQLATAATRPPNHLLLPQTPGYRFPAAQSR